MSPSASILDDHHAPAHPEDHMLVDEEPDADAEAEAEPDELQMDDLEPDMDHDSYGPTHTGPHAPQAPPRPMGRRRRPGDAPPPFDKNARKREQRERDKEQQKQLLNKLIEIFEAGGGTCAVQQGQKKFPWVDLPAALIRIGCYFAGWPEKCLPKMSDKHPDRIDASTGPSQWSLKQKRAMEAQINKGAVKVLPRPDDRAVIFEIVDEFGNIKDSTVEFSENWVRNKLLGLGNTAPSHPPPIREQPRAPQHQGMLPEQALTTTSHSRLKLPRDDYSPPQGHPLALPPIRDQHDQERLDLPSLAKMTGSGLHTPDDYSRSPSPVASTFSDGRSIYPPHYPPSLHPSMSQDDFAPPSSRGAGLSLEHGHGVSSLRSTSRPRPHSQQHNRPHHHHPYPQIITSHSRSTSNLSHHRSSRSRPPSPPLTLNTHHRHHSHSGISPSDTRSAISAGLSSAGYSSGLSPSNGISPATYGGPSPSIYSNGLSPSSAIYPRGMSPPQPQRNPSHVPAVPACVVAWDPSIRGWILKIQSDAALRVLPQRTNLVFWHRETDEWECLPAESERSGEKARAMWNRQAGRWELIFPSTDGAGSPKPDPNERTFLPTHQPALPGFSFYDSSQLCTWVFQPSPGVENMLPSASSAVIIWEADKGVWQIMNGSPDHNAAEIVWSREDKTWVFHMKTTIAEGGAFTPSSSRKPTPPLVSSLPSPSNIKPKTQSPPPSVLLARDANSSSSPQ